MSRTIVFDMDGVLCRYRIERRLALLASWSGRSSDAIHERASPECDRHV
jgi:hypothetical protein